MYVQQAEKLVLDKTSTLADCYTSRLRAELARFYGTLRCLRCWTMQHPLNPVSFTKCFNAFHSNLSVVVFIFKFKDWQGPLALLVAVSWSSPVLAGQGTSKKMVEKYDRYQTGGASKWQGKEGARKWHLLQGNKKVAPSRGQVA